MNASSNCVLSSLGDHRDLHSFPTRRSSDLQGDENPYIKFWSLNPSKNKGAEGKRLRGAKSFGFAMDAVNRKRKSAENYFYKEMRNLVGRFK